MPHCMLQRSSGWRGRWNDRNVDRWLENTQTNSANITVEVTICKEVMHDTGNKTTQFHKDYDIILRLDKRCGTDIAIEELKAVRTKLAIHTLKCL